MGEPEAENNTNTEDITETERKDEDVENRAKTPELNKEKEPEPEENNETIPEVTTTDVETCRLCDEIGEKMFNIFEDNPEGYQLIGLIKENLPIVLYKSDPLSKQVCEKCVLNLQIISALKKHSRKTQDKYVEKLKNEGDTSDKNVLLFLGCTGSKLVENGEDEEEEEEEELKDKCTSTEDLTVLCANCKTAILDASAVNGDIELASNLHKIIEGSLKRNRVMIGSDETEKNLRARKIQPIYQELDDSLCSSLTDLTQNTGGEESASQFEEVEEIESEESNYERPLKRRKIDNDSERLHEENDTSKMCTEDNNSEKTEGNEDEQNHNIVEENEKLDHTETETKVNYKNLFQNEPEFTFEPLSLLQVALNCINNQNVPDYEAIQHFVIKPSGCKCPYCGEEFQNVKLLALHEPDHMEVDMEDKVDNPNPWPKVYPFADLRNKWLTYFDESGCGEEDIEQTSKENKEESNLLLQDTLKTMDVSKKDEVVLVDMKPMVNGIYLGDYTKEERKAFYQCMRIGGQTKRFCHLCRYCFKDNWAIESHYFSLACHYTCRYCGMRFNKQRHRYDEHVKEHKKNKDLMSDKIFTASKVNNTLPKVIQPDKVKRIIPGEPEKPREIKPEDYPNPPVITKGGFDQRHKYSPNQSQFFQNIKIKEEPKDFVVSSQSQGKSQNQAYFCRKCYKVFFKLDEFNAHSKNCDYNNHSSSFKPTIGGSMGGPGKTLVHVKKELGSSSGAVNGDISNAGRPVRNCVRDIGPYKDEVYIPKQLLNETLPGPPQSFVCHICGTPFPTIYSRNSHMRIHKGETQSLPNSPQGQAIQHNILKQRLQQQQHNFQMQRSPGNQQILHQQKIAQQRKQHQSPHQRNNSFMEEIRVKQEPVDSFEPMVEIHEGHEESSSPLPMYQAPQIPRELGGGAVSLTPIVKKPALNPNILKLVQNNPNISISRRPTDNTQRETLNYHGSNIKNAGGYQGPYAPSNHSIQASNSSYINVSPNIMPNEDKSYKCSSCWEAFSNKSHLYFHKKNQCEGSRFPCPFCKKRFGTEAAYSSHIFYSHPE